MKRISFRHHHFKQIIFHWEPQAWVFLNHRVGPLSRLPPSQSTLAALTKLTLSHLLRPDTSSSQFRRSEVNRVGGVNPNVRAVTREAVILMNSF